MVLPSSPPREMRSGRGLQRAAQLAAYVLHVDDDFRLVVPRAAALPLPAVPPMSSQPMAPRLPRYRRILCRRRRRSYCPCRHRGDCPQLLHTVFTVCQIGPRVWSV